MAQRGVRNFYEGELAEKIVELVPSIDKVRMVNSGTEATLSAIRLARGYTNKNKIISPLMRKTKLLNIKLGSCSL